MTGKTHRAGGAVAGVVGFMMLKQGGLLLPDVNEGLQLLVIYPFAMWGSVASDLDHHWESCPSKDAISFGINKVLHLGTPFRKARENLGGHKGFLYHLLGIFDASHRSWQTHSDLILFAVLFALWSVLKNGLISGLSVIDISILSLMLVGICLGLVAHLLLDIITPQGIWLLGFTGVNKLISAVSKRDVSILPEKLHLVPDIGFFATGGTWELIIQRLLKILTLVSLVYLVGLIFPLIGNIWGSIFPYEIKII